MSSEDDLIAEIKKNLLAQFPPKPPPPVDQDDGMQRMANAIGKAIAEKLPSLLTVTTTVGSTDYAGSVTLK